MLILATGTPSADQSDGRIVVSIPSGSDALNIIMTAHEALYLSQILRNVTAGMTTQANQPASAEIIPLRRKRRRTGGK